MQAPELPGDSQIWQSLKQAIAASSGFQRWQQDHEQAESLIELTLDRQVKIYLRETLETLAY
ncbi:MAG: hypothetical protein HC920_00335 [Oscillatoriales cyanobacterium SM2_3_0]|nr:hypothetical protein [Oscillatoriales cyanobacterium SM2_3_0]